MTQINIISGIYARTGSDFEQSYPVNLTPVTETLIGDGTGISKGYLKLIEGVTTKAQLPGADRGGYVWKDTHYRVVGTQLCSVTPGGTVTTIGDVGAGGPVRFAESFDYLAINSGTGLFLFDGATLTQVTDADLGPVLSLIWSDGYFMTTDGSSLVVTELNDPFAVNPLKYGSSEADPDPVVGLLALRGTVYAINRYSIEVFDNRGTTGFPFGRNRGSQIPKGSVGSQAFCPFVETFAFVGSARNEQIAVYLAGAGQAIKISRPGLDEALSALKTAELANIALESISTDGMIRLLVHLPTETWVYHWTASQQLDIPVWSLLKGGDTLAAAFPARHFTYYRNDWWCGSAGALGVVDPTATTMFGKAFGYSFDTPLIYNGGMGAIVNSLELVTLAGRSGGAAPLVYLSYTDEGVTYSQEKPCGIGVRGERNARPAWRRLGRIRSWRGFRFRGVAQAPVAFARLEASLEGLGG